jgi:hypothetical protein
MQGDPSHVGSLGGIVAYVHDVLGAIVVASQLSRLHLPWLAGHTPKDQRR